MTVFAQRGWASSRRLPGSDTSPIEDFSLPPDFVGGCVRDDLGHGHGQGIRRPARRRAGLHRGHSSGFADDLADTTDGGGAFTIDDVPFHRIPSSSIDGIGYEQRIRSVDVDGDESVDVKLVRDWAALEGGADLVSFTPRTTRPSAA